jgi:hypothetical protein
MTINEALALVRRKWGNEGACASCGWHALLSEYEDRFDSLEDAIEINEKEGRVELPCLSQDDEEGRFGHRGARIYFDSPAVRRNEQ